MSKRDHPDEKPPLWPLWLLAAVLVVAIVMVMRARSGPTKLDSACNAMRDLILKRDVEFGGERYRVIHAPTGKAIGNIASEKALLSTWQWAVEHPFGECRAGRKTGREDDLDAAKTAIARYWREAPLPDGMVEHGGFAFMPFKPPKDPWTIKIIRRDAADFRMPREERPQVLAWMSFPEATSAGEAIAEARRAIDDALIVLV